MHWPGWTQFNLIVAVAETDGSVAEVALTCTEVTEITRLGAVYVAVSPLSVVRGDTFPHELSGGNPHSVITVQITPAFAGSLETVAISFTLLPTSKSWNWVPR
jgi:hypothetical protein